MLYSEIRGKDLEELIEYIINTDLKYRNSLGIDERISFGVEIEYERALRLIVDKYIKYKLPGWNSKEDLSLVLGGEVTSPVIGDTKKSWEELREICILLKRLNVITSDNAAGHIHIGTQILGDDLNSWRTFAKTYAIYEDILFRFLYGEMQKGRKRIRMYAAPISAMIINSVDSLNSAETIRELIWSLPLEQKTKAINFTNINLQNPSKRSYKNTIEFRIPNGTVNEIVWQNNINALVKLILAQKDIDEDFLDYQIEHDNLPTRLTYDEICLRKALELVDLIFESDIDKIYFLSQYLKQKKHKAKTFKLKI